MEKSLNKDSESAKETFSIGDFVVEPALNLLINGDEKVTLVPKVMKLLVCLAKYSPEPVSQEALFKHIWPEQVVSDSSLYQAVAQLRKALGDTGKQKEYIERVSGKGYRLLKLVEPVSEANVKSETTGLNPVYWLFPMILLTGAALYYWSENRPSTPNPATQPLEQSANLNSFNIERLESLALINLELEQDSAEQNLIVSAFNDVLLTQLGSIQSLKVISIKNDDTFPEVKAFLTGRVVTENKQVRVYLRLESAEQREVVWAKVFTGDSDRIFQLQDEVTRDLLSLFNKKQTGETFSQQSITPEVFDQYLLARHLWEKRKAQKLLQAKSILESLRDKQQLFPLAAVALCETYHFLYLYSDWELEEVNAQCAPLLDLALEKSPNLGQALAAKGLLLSSLGKREEAKAHFERAIENAPNYSMGFLWFGNLLREMGDYQLSLKMSMRAFELAPMSPIVNRSLAYSHLNLREVDKANYYYQRAITLEPDYIHRPIGDLDFYPLTKERARSFLKWAKNYPGAFQRDSTYRLNQAQVWLAIGKTSEAEQVVNEFVRSGISPAYTQYVKATVEISQGKFDEAVETFNQRREFPGEKARLDMPYIQSLMTAGRYHEALKLTLQWFPEFENDDAEVNEENFTRAMFFVQLKHRVVKGYESEVLAQKIDKLVVQQNYPVSIQMAEWLVYRGNKSKAVEIVNQLMDEGWLPDTNSEPYAYIRMKRLFMGSGLGGEAFESKLKANIDYVRN